MYSAAFIFKPGTYDDEFHRLNGSIDEAAKSTEGYLGAEAATNNTAELNAVVCALEFGIWRFNEANAASIQVWSDSLYPIGTVSEGWGVNRNRAIVERARKNCTSVRLMWRNSAMSHVRGHQSNRWKDEVDRRCTSVLRQSIDGS